MCVVCELSWWCRDALTPSHVLTGKHIDRVSEYIHDTQIQLGLVIFFCICLISKKQFKRTVIYFNIF